MTDRNDSPVPRVPKRIFWKEATADDFINALEVDWIEGVGEISTYYELRFVRAFGEAMKSHVPKMERYIEVPMKSYSDLRMIFNRGELDQMVRGRPVPAPSSYHIGKAISELEYSLRAGPQEEIDCHIREALEHLKSGGTI